MTEEKEQQRGGMLSRLSGGNGQHANGNGNGSGSRRSGGGRILIPEEYARLHEIGRAHV